MRDSIIFSGAILVIGMLTYWIFRPRVFRTHLFTERAFEFWQFKWLMFVMVWGLFTSHRDPRWALAASDLNSAMSIGFVFALLAGEKYSERLAIVNLVFLFGLLFSWNLGFAALVPPVSGHLVWLWVRPSMAFAALGLFGMAVAATLRYHRQAIGFCVLTALYMILQMPSYEILFGVKQLDNNWLLLLAFTKLLYGLSFYAFCFMEPKSIEALQAPSWGFLTNGNLQRAFWFVVLAVLAGILEGFGKYVGDWLIKIPHL